MDVVRVLAGLMVVAVAGLCGAGSARAAILDYEVFDGTGGHSAAAPIVMVLHGAMGSGPQVRRSSGFDAWAKAARVVAVYPSGDGRLWNDGRLAENARKQDLAARDDVADLIGLARALEARGLGDADRLYVIGHSNGGGMAIRLACDWPEAIRGIAVIATKVLKDVPCAKAAAPVPAVFFYGTMDELNPHEGRSDAANRRDRNLGYSYSAADSLAIWAQRNGCSARGAGQKIDGTEDGVSVTRWDWAGCAAPLRYFETAGGGHAWPGVPLRRFTLLGRDAPEVAVTDINAGQEAMRFFFGG
jgi:polyhydroxybutyrate depolymerase